MKKLPEIVEKNQMVPPQNPEENILYIAHYGFNTKLLPAVIIFHPDFNKHELYSFEIRTTGCHTHVSCMPYEIEESLSDDVYSWMEQNIVVSDDSGYAIRKWNEPLWFDKKGTLTSGFKISCPETLGPEYKEPWINIYDGAHIEGEDFEIEIIETSPDMKNIKLKITGNSEGWPILFIGWFPMEYIDPNTWIDNFFKDLRDGGNEIARLKKANEHASDNTYRNFPERIHERYFSRNIEKSPYWEKYNKNYHECITAVANIYGFDAKLEPQTPGQDQWVFKLKSS